MPSGITPSADIVNHHCVQVGFYCYRLLQITARQRQNRRYNTAMKQATVKEVKAIVNRLADMRDTGWYRRVWTNKSTNPAIRHLAFRFWDADEANTVADKLQQQLRAAGFTNTVKRTSVAGEWEAHREGGEYVRVQALFE